MNTQQDFELTAKEINELKDFLSSSAITLEFATENKKPTYPNFAQLTKQSEIKQYLSEIKTLTLYRYGDITLPMSIQYLNNVTNLQLIECNFLKTLPENLGKLNKLRRLQITKCGILQSLPDSIELLKELKEIFITLCSNLIRFPESMGGLNQLKELFLTGCSNLIELPESIGQLDNLQKIDILGCSNLITLPEQIGKLKNLQSLNLANCKNLTFLPASIADLKKLKYFSIAECNRLTDIPECIQKLPFFSYYKDVWEMQEKREIKSKARRSHKAPLTPEQKKAKKVLAQMKKDTATPIIKIKSKKAKKLPLTASKFGGVPYWDLQKPYPVDENGDKLALLAQIDLAELPPLPDFPEKGLLQFFIGLDDRSGMDCDNRLSQKGWRVIYHESVNPSITEKEVLNLDIPLENMPLGDTQYQLSFDLGSQSMGLCDYRFEKLFKTTAEKLKIKFDEDDELLDLIEEDTHEKLYNSTAGHHIGGYPIFTQDDPRYDEELAEHTILLLQIDSKNGIMWGDAGVGNFFITADDLKKRDFSRVLYNWDCA